MAKAELKTDIGTIYGWLVERKVGIGGAATPSYCFLSPHQLPTVQWTEDHEKAIRFARKEDAEAFAACIVPYEVKICEHAWDGSAPEEPAAA